MAVKELSVSGYRSIRRLRLELGGVNILTGPYGCGKSNLYNALLLVARAAAGELARAIAREGGMTSVLWAGVQKRFGRKPEPRRLRLAVKTTGFAYELECGLPQRRPPQDGLDHEGFLTPASLFLLDPEVKFESIHLAGPRGGRVLMMERHGPLASLRNAEGRMAGHPVNLAPAESMLSQIQEPHLYPEIAAVRAEFGRWRFYHHFRTDPDAPLRHPQAGVFTPVLASDGRDLAAALETIAETGDADTLREEIDAAFPGSRVEVVAERSYFRVVMRVPGVLRPLEAAELSDGTLRYLCLVAALLSPRPAGLVGLNEPETSVHPDLIPALARLIARAARRSQLWVTTHSPALAERIAGASGEAPVRLVMTDGETRLG
jgi:predicted ATPase